VAGFDRQDGANGWNDAGISGCKVGLEVNERAYANASDDVCESEEGFGIAHWELVLTGRDGLSTTAGKDTD